MCLASYLQRYCGPMVGVSLPHSSKRVGVLHLSESGFQGTSFRVYIPTSLKEALRDVGMISSVTKKTQTTSAFFPVGASRTGGMKWALGDGSLAFRASARKGEVQGQSCMWEQSREISPPANCPASCFGDRLTASFPTVDGSGTQRSDLEKITLQIRHSSGEAS